LASNKEICLKLLIAPTVILHYTTKVSPEVTDLIFEK